MPRAAQSFWSPNDSSCLRFQDTQSFEPSKASGHSMLRIIQGFGPPKASDLWSPKTSGHPRLRTTPRFRVIQGFWSLNDSGCLRFQVTQGFGPSKAPGHPRLQVAQISGFQSSLMKNRKKKKGGIGLFRPSDSVPMSKNRCLENLEHRFCCIHNETVPN